METAYLEEYACIVRLRSLTAAARELHVVQSTLSKHVAVLERDLGVELLVREKGGVAPTTAGEALYRESVPVLKAHENLRRHVRSAAAEPKGAPLPAPDMDGPSPLLRLGCRATATRHGLTAPETGALALFLEGRPLSALQKELEVSREKAADLLGCAYRKLAVTDRQQALDLIYSELEKY